MITFHTKRPNGINRNISKHMGHVTVSVNQKSASRGCTVFIENLWVVFAVSHTASRVVTRYMGSGITASGSGSWTRDPGSQVMGSGSANFFWSWRGSRIDRFLDTLFFMRNKNIPFCKEKGLFSGLLKKLLTFILQFFYASVTQSAV